MGKVNAMAMDRIERAYDRGHADKYYGRFRRPHMWLDSMGRVVVPKDRMSDDEIEAYNQGYDNCTVTKDWGDDE